jgi:Flp pilus assembly protein TadG
MMSIIRRFCRLLTRFLTDRRGGVAPIFALTIIPVVGLVGAGIDYGRANSIRTGMQSALDATALAMAKLAPTLTQTQLQQQSTAYFLTMFIYSDAKNLTIIPTYTTVGGSQLTIVTTTTMDTYFMKVMGFPTLNIGSSTTVKWGNSRLRVALVLDTTGSMADDGKMPALQTATKALLTQLKNAAATNGDVYVSIIPFSKNVNVGASNFNATWIDWTDWAAEPAIIRTSKPSGWSSVGPGDNCPFTSASHGFQCAPDPTSTSTTSTIPSSGTYSGYICPSTDTGGKNATLIGIMYNGCYNSVSNPKIVATGSFASCGSLSDCTCSGSGSSRVCKQAAYDHTWLVNAHSTWNGCVADRGATAAPSGDYDRVITAPTASIVATLFPAEQNSYCSPAILGLTYTWTAMNTLVDNLYPLGATNQPIGLIWGWQSLAGGGPLTMPPKDSSYTYNTVIVLLSDGLNTLDRWYGNGSSPSISVDQRMYESVALGTCANIKAAGVTIYTIQVNTGGDSTSTLLQNCASGTDKFWMVTTANGIGTVFNQIGTALSKLRVAK